MMRSMTKAGLALLVMTLTFAGCYGTGTAYVGVYGPPVYGPGPWGGYPYPGAYPPYGGGVWVGVPVCCEEDQEQQEQDPAVDEEQEPGEEEAENPVASAGDSSAPDVAPLQITEIRDER